MKRRLPTLKNASTSTGRGLNSAGRGRGFRASPAMVMPKKRRSPMMTRQPKIILAVLTYDRSDDPRYDYYVETLSMEPKGSSHWIASKAEGSSKEISRRTRVDSDLSLLIQNVYRQVLAWGIPKAKRGNATFHTEKGMYGFTLGKEQMRTLYQCCANCLPNKQLTDVPAPEKE